ncbi:periplasmic spermidine/putrescine-binding protein [Spirochaetia bacterium]|nr:periplasmic spermidine/putrescine-binding protein [Spirochaetia bacterium]
MKKNKFVVLALAGVVALFLVLLIGIQAGGSREGKAKKQLTLYTWAEIFPREILDGFEKETGYTINYVNFDEDETMMTKLQTAGGGDYDLIIADDYIIETAIVEGLVRKLDKTKLPNYRNINPIYQQQFYDPEDAYTVPYGAGVVTLAYDPRKVSVKIRGYADLWDPSLKDKIGIMGNFRVINGMALKVLGQSYNTNDITVIRQAGEKLLGLAPNIRLIRDTGLEDEFLSGEIAAGVFYTDQATTVKLERPELELVFPAEGIGFGIMAGFIPSNAPNADAAYAFLNYILDAQNGAACFEHLLYYSTYAASDPYISDELRPFLTLPEGFNIDMEMIQNINEAAEEEHNRIWTAFKERSGK